MDNDRMLEVGNGLIDKLIRTRKSLGMKINDLSEKSGVSKYTIYKIEAYDHKPSLDTLLLLCDALDCRLEIVKGRL